MTTLNKIQCLVCTGMTVAMDLLNALEALLSINPLPTPIEKKLAWVHLDCQKSINQNREILGPAYRHWKVSWRNRSLRYRRIASQSIGSMWPYRRNEPRTSRLLQPKLENAKLTLWSAARILKGRTNGILSLHIPRRSLGNSRMCLRMLKKTMQERADLHLLQWSSYHKHSKRSNNKI